MSAMCTHPNNLYNCTIYISHIIIIFDHNNNIEEMGNLITFLALIIISCSSAIVLAHEPSPLQDFCVADFNNSGQ